MMEPAVLARVKSRFIVAENGCWIWQGATSRGYAQIGVQRKIHQVHRLMYEHYRGPVPTGLVLDHTCHSNDLECDDGSACVHRRCVNPAHVEPVTQKVNMERGIHARKEECPKGHPYSGDNLYVDKTGRRHCKECRRGNVRRHYKNSDGAAYFRAYRARKKAADETE